MEYYWAITIYNTNTCHSMDGPQKHLAKWKKLEKKNHAKWKKPDQKANINHILYDPTYMECLKLENSYTEGTILVVYSGWG